MCTCGVRMKFGMSETPSGLGNLGQGETVPQHWLRQVERGHFFGRCLLSPLHCLILKMETTSSTDFELRQLS